MADSPPPVIQVRQDEKGSWYVAVTWHSGRMETTGNFRTELEAKEWAHTHLQTWLEGRKARDTG